MLDRWIDLHIHSSYSDGLLTPTEIVEQARKIGLSAIAITDHDTLEGIPEAVDAGERLGLDIVPGVELSSQSNGKDIHILGYFIDQENRRLNGYLRRFRRARYDRAVRMARNLEGMGIQVSIEEVEGRARGGNIGRPHFAEILMEKGYVETFQEAFHRFIGYGSKAYVEKYKIPPEEAIRLIAEAGGLSFLAHPSHLISDEFITSLIKVGLDGLEIVHPKLAESRTRHLQHLALSHEILVSGGSDCHGGREGCCSIGHYTVPYSTLESIIKVLEGRRGDGNGKGKRFKTE